MKAHQAKKLALYVAIKAEVKEDLKQLEKLAAQSGGRKGKGKDKGQDKGKGKGEARSKERPLKLKKNAKVYVTDTELDDPDGPEQVWSALIIKGVKAPTGETGDWYSLCFDDSEDSYDYPRVRIFNSESEACLDMLSF